MMSEKNTALDLNDYELLAEIMPYASMMIQDIEKRDHSIEITKKVYNIIRNDYRSTTQIEPT